MATLDELIDKEIYVGASWHLNGGSTVEIHWAFPLESPSYNEPLNVRAKTIYGDGTIDFTPPDMTKGITLKGVKKFYRTCLMKQWVVGAPHDIYVAVLHEMAQSSPPTPPTVIAKDVSIATPSISIPTVSLPSVPTISIPSFSMPSIPSLPSLPSIPGGTGGFPPALPDVSALQGLIATALDSLKSGVNSAISTAMGQLTNIMNTVNIAEQSFTADKLSMLSGLVDKYKGKVPSESDIIEINKNIKAAEDTFKAAKDSAFKQLSDMQITVNSAPAVLASTLSQAQAALDGLQSALSGIQIKI